MGNRRHPNIGFIQKLVISQAAFQISSKLILARKMII